MKRLNGKSPSDKQRKRLPKEWRQNFADLESKSTTQSTIAARFDVSTSVILRWRKDHAKFANEFERVHKPSNRAAPKPKRKIVEGKLSPDDIDDLMFALLDRPSAEDAKLARMAIRQLRKKIRELRSVINRIQHAEHLRKQGGTPTTHQNGNAASAQHSA